MNYEKQIFCYKFEPGPDDRRNAWMKTETAVKPQEEGQKKLSPITTHAKTSLDVVCSL